MKKKEKIEIQKQINLECQQAFQRALKKINWHEIISYPLFSCHAKVLEIDKFFILESYQTLISVYEKESHTLYDCLRDVYGYTATSNQHFRKFEKWLNEHGHYVISMKRYYD